MKTQFVTKTLIGELSWTYHTSKISDSNTSNDVIKNQLAARGGGGGGVGGGQTSRPVGYLLSAEEKLDTGKPRTNPRIDLMERT